MSGTKKMVLASLLCAAGIVLPLAFHTVPDAGKIFLPMHIPVLLCGLICGWPFGLACGALTPLLSSLITSMPTFAMLPGMICELAVYGAVSGFMAYEVRTGSRTADIYISLISAMLAGRITSGIVNALFFSRGSYTRGMWVTVSFVKAVPGIAAQLVIIPLLITVLERAGLINGVFGAKGK